jgi:hypothetical protein
MFCRVAPMRICMLLLSCKDPAPNISAFGYELHKADHTLCCTGQLVYEISPVQRAKRPTLLGQ